MFIVKLSKVGAERGEDEVEVFIELDMKGGVSANREICMLGSVVEWLRAWNVPSSRSELYPGLATYTLS